jgi:hypothetical protein
MTNYLYTEALNAAACDGDGCQTWSRNPEEHGFVLLVWGDTKFTFCSPDCCLKHLATYSTPLEVISNE